MRKVPVFLGLLACVAGQPAFAYVDISKTSCSDFAQLDQTALIGFYMWIDGYRAGQSGRVTVDTDVLAETMTPVAEICRANPEMPIMTAVETNARASK